MTRQPLKLVITRGDGRLVTITLTAKAAMRALLAAGGGAAWIYACVWAVTSGADERAPASSELLAAALLPQAAGIAKAQDPASPAPQPAAAPTARGQVDLPAAATARGQVDSPAAATAPTEGVHLPAASTVGAPSTTDAAPSAGATPRALALPPVAAAPFTAAKSSAVDEAPRPTAPSTAAGVSAEASPAKVATPGSDRIAHAKITQDPAAVHVHFDQLNPSPAAAKGFYWLVATFRDTQGRVQRVTFPGELALDAAGQPRDRKSASRFAVRYQRSRVATLARPANTFLDGVTIGVADEKGHEASVIQLAP